MSSPPVRTAALGRCACRVRRPSPESATAARPGRQAGGDPSERGPSVSRPGAAEVFSSGSSVAMVQPAGTRYVASPVSRSTGISTARDMIERCASRVLSSAQRRASSPSPPTTSSSSAGCSSRSTMAQPSAAIRFDIDAMWISATSSPIPRIRSACGSDDQASTMRPNSAVSAIVAGVQSVHSLFDHRDDGIQRRPFGSLVRRGDGGHRVRVHERVRPVQCVERRDQLFEGVSIGRSRPSPRRQPHPVSEPAGEAEQVHGAFGTQFGHRLVQRPVQVREVRRDVVAAKQGRRQYAPADEDLIGKLAPQHQVVGDALARRFLGQRVERRDTRGGEGEQIMIVAAVNGERVAVPGAGGRDRGDRVVDRDIPRQPGALGDRRRRCREAVRH